MLTQNVATDLAHAPTCVSQLVTFRKVSRRPQLNLDGSAATARFRKKKGEKKKKQDKTNKPAAAESRCDAILDSWRLKKAPATSFVKFTSVGQSTPSPPSPLRREADGGSGSRGTERKQ